jgi:hypothetical protein
MARDVAWTFPSWMSDASYPGDFLCQAMTSNPKSTAAVDEERRQRVRERVLTFNRILRSTCRRYAHCLFDNDAAYYGYFRPKDLSQIDYFHPSTSGQAQISQGTWEATYDFTSDAKPRAPRIAVAQAPAAGTQRYQRQASVFISAETEDRATRIEYRLNPGDHWQLYEQPFELTELGTHYIYARAISSNGNSSRLSLLKLEIVEY